MQLLYWTIQALYFNYAISLMVLEFTNLPQPSYLISPISLESSLFRKYMIAPDYRKSSPHVLFL